MPRARVSRLRFWTLASLLALGCGGDDGVAMDASASTKGEASAARDDAGSQGSAADATLASSTPDSGRASDAGVTNGNGDASTVRPADSGTSDSGALRDAASMSADASGTGNPSDLPRFSFFVTSEAAIRDLSKNAEGFGGDLRYGETGAGAGLRGADKICTEIAERAMPGAGSKQWRAFLSAASGGTNGGVVNARDRIGQGPWYDRMGRLVGNNLADLLSGSRPAMADAQIRNDLPNETGTPNHAPDGTAVDNHDTVTGSDASGNYVSGSNTCLDWTSSAAGSGGGGGGGSGPAVGHSWPRSASNGMHWVSDHRAGGCGRGINTMNGTSDGTPTIGSGGGYGGFYCFGF